MIQRIKNFIPKTFLSSLRAVKLRYLSSKSAEEVFTDIYANGKWGKNDKPFFSGVGSTEKTRGPFVESILQFIQDNQIKSIVDLGCGDFQVGSQLVFSGIDYLGCDIVRPLIEYNQRTFGKKNIRFMHCNMIDDELPSGQLCIIRQVFQHLSNESIIKVLEKLNRYEYVIIADAQPTQDKAKVNLNIPNFSGTRAVVHGTGIWLEHSPFSLPIVVLKQYKLESRDDEYLRIVLYRPTH